MGYIPVSLALPAPLVDVLGLVPDDDGDTPILVFRRADGQFFASQMDRDIRLEVTAWAPVPAPHTDHWLCNLIRDAERYRRLARPGLDEALDEVIQLPCADEIRTHKMLDEALDEVIQLPLICGVEA